MERFLNLPNFKSHTFNPTDLIPLIESKDLIPRFNPQI